MHTKAHPRQYLSIYRKNVFEQHPFLFFSCFFRVLVMPAVESESGVIPPSLVDYDIPHKQLAIHVCKADNKQTPSHTHSPTNELTGSLFNSLTHSLTHSLN